MSIYRMTTCALASHGFRWVLVAANAVHTKRQKKGAGGILVIIHDLEANERFAALCKLVQVMASPGGLPLSDVGLTARRPSVCAGK